MTETAIEQLRSLPLPTTLSTRRMASQVINGLYEGSLSIGQEEILRLVSLRGALENPELKDLAQRGNLTIGLVKPNIHLDGQGFSSIYWDDSDIACKQILEEIDPERLALTLPFRFRWQDATHFYEKLREKYLHKEQIPNKYNPSNISVYESLIHFTASGPSTILVITGEAAVEWWREKAGETNPEKAAPGTIRNKFGLAKNLPNSIVHGSDSPEEATRELELVTRFIDNLTFEAIKARDNFSPEPEVMKILTAGGLSEEARLILQQKCYFDPRVREILYQESGWMPKLGFINNNNQSTFLS